MPYRKPLEEVARYEKEFLDSLDGQHADLMLELAEKADMTEDIEGRLQAACEAFTQGFKASLERQTAAT